MCSTEVVLENGCTVTVVMHRFIVYKYILKFNQQAKLLRLPEKDSIYI